MLINSGIPRRNRYAPMLECTAIFFVLTVACVITEDRGRMLFRRRGFAVLDAPLCICFFGGTVRFAGDAAACVSEDGGRNCEDYIDDDCNDHNDLLLRDDPLLIGRAVTGHVCPEISGTGREEVSLVSQCGAIGEIRTPDLLITNQSLCRLSYNSISEGFTRGAYPSVGDIIAQVC